MRNPFFCRGDLDGFFGLFVDNLVQFLTVIFLLQQRCNIAPDSPLFLRYIFPGAAVSLLAGNLFYAWQAHRVAKRAGRSDVTALPYGINTPSLLVFIFFVMGPAYDVAIAGGAKQDAAARHAWVLGLIACLGSGVIEFAGAFIAERIRRATPRAALLSTLAGIAVGFISMTFALQIFQRPLVAMPPLAVILVTYFARVKFPLAMPGGLLAVLIGTLSAWLLVPWLPRSIAGPPMEWSLVSSAWEARGFYLPSPVVGEIWATLSQPQQWIGALSVIIPMGLFNVVGSLQNIESAEAAGDRYDTRSSLAVNGVGTLLAAAFGSCFPTTIYIGHPGWKELGARSGYSTLNGLVITLICLTGTVSTIAALVPLEAGVAIVLWIGVIITAQAYQTTPAAHAPAVAVGLFPAIAAFGWTVTQGAFLIAGQPTVQNLIGDVPAMSHAASNGFLLHGMLVLERGYIFTCMILAAVSVFLIERRFVAAACWSLVAALLTALGLMHAYQITGNVPDFLYLFQTPADGATAFRPWGIAIGYLAFAALFAISHWWFAEPPVGNLSSEHALFDLEQAE
ncbi:MAG: NCS2 family permease [Planctomycetota bacterium]|nr:NCS2 family permease [Planctomycetaceae bacterium]MDQ3330044.1 NCS2 family permease [Planctomycetota bacterium]